MTDDAVVFEKVGRTAIITLNRPQKRNALCEAISEAMPAALRAAREDREVRSVVLTGAGGSFCSGFDLGSLDPGDEPAFAGRELVLGFHRWFGELQDLEKPVIAAVDGVAVGAGFSLALAADFVFVTPRTRLLPTFLGLGLVPDLSMLYVLPRLIGLARAKEIVFSARALGAEEAIGLGLAQTVVAPEQLRDSVLEYAQQFDEAPTHALGLVKTLLNRSFETDRHAMNQFEALAQSLCGDSNYHAEAVRRFLAKEGLPYRGAARLAP
ncbi:enoyl-CoA hydratase/isomerase family protein [Pseudomonas sp. PDM18]|uniref:Enoyl-CoA hydratase/isomerase family protein n=1 Tax=Pseudomonas nitroreducens TaxID=46680 RepID=A0A5R9AIF5_PSENT|nr:MULTISPECIES: enoyl-CoA hydratase/isomerase family protein [Pseudomonas]MBD9679460.1 enoyl-CoA hydratase/isomerase family protein [Pseudomonas sp. PDM18]TLP77636.1 enoyl-CoA hydratase/isomerase family protein [Pseudomonas nitroreducens]